MIIKICTGLLTEQSVADICRWCEWNEVTYFIDDNIMSIKLNKSVKIDTIYNRMRFRSVSDIFASAETDNASFESTMNQLTRILVGCVFKLDIQHLFNTNIQIHIQIYKNGGLDLIAQELQDIGFTLG